MNKPCSSSMLRWSEPMWMDHWNNALRALRSSPVLTVLMVLALGLGIGACMTTLTVYRVLSADPIPGKSQQLFEVQLDAGDLVDFKPGAEPQSQLTRFDAEALLRDAKAPRQTLMSGAHLGVVRETPGAEPSFVEARYASSDFFAMFEAPLAHGRGWTAQEDQDAARVVLIGSELARQLFGDEAKAVGQPLQVRGQSFQVIGVMKTWTLNPTFFDFTLGPYGRNTQLWLPFSSAMAAKFGRSGNMNCWGNGGGSEGPLSLKAECAWLQYWVELPNAQAAATYKGYLQRYSEAQRSAGRFLRPVNVRLRNVPEVLDFNRAVPDDVRLQTFLAFGFLGVCLVNMAGLLLAKTLRRAGEIGIRRALGAQRRTVFAQFIVEAGLVGALGSLLGLLLAMAGLWAVRQGPSSYAHLAQMDPLQLGLSLLLGMSAALLAGLLPAWRATLVSPALQLKVQ
jgi:putative ABC transport system permease protein